MRLARPLEPELDEDETVQQEVDPDGSSSEPEAPAESTTPEVQHTTDTSSHPSPSSQSQ